MSPHKREVFNAKTFDQVLTDNDNPLLLYRDTLRQGRQALARIHDRLSRATVVVAWHAWLVDEILCRAWQQHLSLVPGKIDIALVAVGGYGRGELHPASDVDLLILLKKDQTEQIKNFIEKLLNFLWDIGLEVGHSVRTLKECVRQSKADITVATNLMEARLLHGDEALFKAMQIQTSAPKVWPSKKFFTAKRNEQIRRHQRFDDTAYNLEPNVKEGPGGLRDIQMITWVTQREFNTSSLKGLVDHGFLTEEEYHTLIRGRNFLWYVRNSLHFLAMRREDRLLFDHQREIALQTGYTDKPGSLAVEQFMKRYYRTIKDLSLLNEILLQHFEEAILTRGKAKIKPINRRFQNINGFIEVRDEAVFARSPFALLELFLCLEQDPSLKGVRAHTIRLVRANLDRINDAFRRDIVPRSLFMEILRQHRGITHALRTMNNYGILGAYLPAFGKIIGQMQHDLFHVYTVDEHILFVIRNLRRFTVPEHEHEFPFASQLMKTLVKPERLYLAALFHDIAKGRGGSHSELGENDANAFCNLHGLSNYDTQFIGWLVRHHLAMSMVAQRQDIQDPKVVEEFAILVGNQERLDNLYLLTIADIRGTSPKVWNTWKQKLLMELYTAASRMLDRGLESGLDLQDRIREVKDGTLELLRMEMIDPEKVKTFWSQMHDNYMLRYNAESLVWHAKLITAVTEDDLPLVATRQQDDLGGTEILIYTTDRKDLFTIITEGLGQLTLSVVDARINTTSTDYALDTFVVLDHNDQVITNPMELAHIQQSLQNQLRSPRLRKDMVTHNLPRQLKHFPIETQVLFQSATSKTTTIMEVQAQDRPGLLCQIAHALQACNVNLTAAKITTYGERAEDIFFINRLEQDAPLSEDQLNCLKREIIKRLQLPSRPSEPASAQKT